LQVYRYPGGKRDWQAFNLPTEGEQAGKPRAGTLARSDVPVCAPADSLAAIRSRLSGSDWRICVVVVHDRVVQGQVDLDRLKNEEGEAQQFMRANARTFRPYAEPKSLLDAMNERKFDTVLVTTSDGELLGAVRRRDVEPIVQSPNDR
jgi:CBS domain-containing protein